MLIADGYRDSVDCSIIIVNRNGAEVLTDCLESIKRYLSDSPYSYEVVLVDNGSSDGSVGLALNILPGITVIQNSCNEGFSLANNRGISKSQGEIIFLLNNDTYLLDNSIDLLLDFARQHPNAIVGPLLSYPDGTYQISAFSRFPGLLDETLKLFKLGTIARLINPREIKVAPSVPQKCAYVMMAACMFSRARYQIIGPLSECFVFGMEDVDYCYRNLHSGGTVIYYPLVTLIHLFGWSRKERRRDLDSLPTGGAAERIWLFRAMGSQGGGVFLYAVMALLAFSLRIVLVPGQFQVYRKEITHVLRALTERRK